MNYARIVIVVPGDRVRAWVLVLADALRACVPLPVQFYRMADAEAASHPLPFETLERRLVGAPVPDYANWISTSSLSQIGESEWTDSLVISALERDPCELPPDLRAATILAPVFEGGYRLGELLSALLSCNAPVLGVAMVTAAEGRLLHAATVAVPDRELTSRALTTVLARAIVLLRGATEHLVNRKPLPALAADSLAKRSRSVVAPRLQRVLRTYLPKVGRQLAKPFVRSEDWCIGYRRAGLGGNPPDIDLDAPDLSLIRSDRSRFYADPMLFRHDGTTALFFEDFDYRTNLGRISFVVLSDDGVCSEPTEALSRAYHLSYPFVFSHAGAVLMVPETSNNRTVELYEATSFPDTWRLRSVLLENIDAADATLYFDDGSGTWWMFASVCEYDNWDALSIFQSRSVDGPWRPHPANPVKLDPGSSRPAGPLIRSGQRLLRPAQDCMHRYGHGLVWCEINELTPSVFREEIVGRLSPGRGYTGLHTYCRAAGFEVVDFKRTRWKGVPGSRSRQRRNAVVAAGAEHRGAIA